MRKINIAVLLAASTFGVACAQDTQNPFAGRWDMTVTAGDDKYPSWMEVQQKDGSPVVRAQGRTGNVKPVASAHMEGKRLMVMVSAATATAPALSWELTANNGKLSGQQKRGDSVEGQLVGVRAPALQRAAPKAWTEPQALFNGKDLTGWEPVNNTPSTFKPVPLKSYWTAKDGELVNEGKGSNLKTTRKFDDFKLHVEFNCPQGENSGVYLRGRYEVQVAPARTAAMATVAARGAQGTPPNPTQGLGGVYGFLAPMAELRPMAPGEWQTYDITLVGRHVTVVLNGVTTVDNQEIAGITGGALDSNEGEPGPLYLQGDHHGGIRYRNVTISVPKR